jgi:acyl-CoA thioesterase
MSNHQEKQALAEKIVHRMMEHDLFSQWLGLEVLENTPGSSKVRMTVRPEMCNGFHVAHGGITYSLSDSAFAFASNGKGIRAMSIETSVNHVVSVKAGDILTATCSEEFCGNKIAMYRVVVQNQEDITVAIFKGIVYRSGKPWFPDEETT